MRVDLKARHGVEARKAAVDLFESGYGYKSAAAALSIPRGTVRKWLDVYRAFGSEVLLAMDRDQAKYTHEQRVAAASAVVDDGMAKPEAMKAFGIFSITSLDRWCRLYRKGGAEALGPKPKGGAKGRGLEPSELARLQELEERCRRLETEVAYLKKLRALAERDGL